MENQVYLFAKISLIFVFLVVLAGSVVRMTGSGMGCPDWPKCFGYLIPPTEESQVLWSPHREYIQGTMIVHDNALWKATQTFESGATLDMDKWEKYELHDYAIFNAFHTWVEYINRLIGAATGIPVLLLVIFSFRHFIKTKRFNFLGLSLGVLFLLGFSAWLGKKVVEGNLIPGSITMHMAGAALLIVLLVILIYKSSPSPLQIDFGKHAKTLLLVLLLLSAFQVFLGTQVREEIDLLSKAGVIPRIHWIENLPDIFKFHRSFSILVVLLNGLLIYRYIKMGGRNKWINRLGGILIVEILLGIGLTYTGMPEWMQPTHLIAAMLLIAIQTYLIFTARKMV